MDKTGIVARKLHCHLPNGFQEWQRLNVADCSADLNDSHLCVTRTGLDVQFNFVGYVRNNLYSAAQIVAAPFLFNHALIDLARREIVAPAHPGTDKTLVMPKIEIGFCSILGDKYFAVLKWTHGTGIHVDIGIQLKQGNLDTASFEDGCKGGTRDTFP